jgi:GntR family transcriptional repressor for pyruvate dehydrogenase complex
MKAAHAQADHSEEADADADLHLAIYEAAHNRVMLHTMRAFSTLLRNGVFFNRTQLYTRPGVRDMLLDQHLTIAEAVLAGDAGAARAAAEKHIDFTVRTLHSIRQDESRLAVSLQRVGRSDLVDSGAGS